MGIEARRKPPKDAVAPPPPSAPPMPDPNPTISAAEFARELLAEFDANRDSAFRLRDQSRDQAKREYHDDRGLEWNEASKTLLNLAARHGVNIEEGGE